MFDQFGRWLRRQQGIERNPIYRLATEVSEGRMTPEAAYQEVENNALLNRLADGDLWELDRETSRAAVDDPQHALIIARLAILAARYKGFDRVLIDCNLRAADILGELNNEKEQELHLREALHAAERIASVSGQRRALARLARLAFDRGDTERARELLERQLEAGREDVDTLEDVDTALLAGDMARNDGDPSAAREYYHRAARGAKRVGHYAGVVDALLRQVVVLREHGDTDGAFLLLQQAQDAAERTIDTRLQGEIAIQTGALLVEKHQYVQARSHIMTALERARTAADIAMEARCLTGLAQIDSRSGQIAEAADHYRNLAELEQRLGNRSAAVRAFSDEAEIKLQMRDPSGALTSLQSALAIADSLDDPSLRLNILGLLGLTFSTLERRNEALEALMGAVQQARRLGDVEEEGRWLLGVGEVLLQFGEVDDALAATRRALEIAQEYHIEQLEAQGLALTGSINVTRGLYREAEEALQRAVNISRGWDEPTEQLGYLQILARIGRAAGDAQAAIRYLRQALDVATVYPDPETRSRIHGQLARLYEATRQYGEAEGHYRAALAAAEDAETPALISRALRGLAALQDTTGDSDSAIETYERALAVSEELGDLRGAMVLRYNLGALLHDKGRDSEARAHLNQTVEIAMDLGDYGTADAARDLLRWVSPAPQTEGVANGWEQDFLLEEIAVNDEPTRLREHPRD